MWSAHNFSYLTFSTIVHLQKWIVKYKNTLVEGLDQSINQSAKRITKFYSVEEGELVSSLEEGEILG